MFLKEADITIEKVNKVRLLNQIAIERNQTMAQMALAWIMRHKNVTSVLVGASKPEQVLDSIGCLDNLVFTEDELKRIDIILG